MHTLGPRRDVVLKMPKIHSYVQKDDSQNGLGTEHGDFQGIELSAFQIRQYPRHASAQDLLSRAPHHSSFLATTQLEKAPIGRSYFLTECVIVEILDRAPTGEKGGIFRRQVRGQLGTLSDKKDGGFTGIRHGVQVAQLSALA
jgi:hypothetical protein